jgi:peptide/nickel transport system substrate-binding protein
MDAMQRLMAGITAAVAASTLALAASVAGAAVVHRAPMGTAPLVLGDQDGSPTYTENFNPLSPNALEGWWYMYEPLIAIGGLTGDAVPMLATGSKWTNGNKTLTFTLRSNVKWSNGAPFTAQDVVFTFNLLKKYPALDTNGIWKNIRAVSASGDTVSFDFNAVDIPFAQFIDEQPIVYPPQFTGVDPVKFTDPSPIVTGPFVLAQFTPQAYIMKANPLYWDKAAISVPEIKEVALGSNTTADLQLSEGMFDEAVLFEPDIQQVYVAKNPKAYHYYFPLASPVNIYFNLTEKPFNEVAFRQAIAYAVNRQEIYQKGEYGYEPPANQSLLPPALWGSWLDKSLAAKYAYNYDPKKAQALLASIGYKKNAAGQLVGPNGQQLSFTLEVPTGWTDWIADCQIIQQELGQLGIKVNVETPSQTTDYNDVQTGHFQAALVFGWQQFNPYFVYYYLLSSATSAPVGQVATFNANSERYDNPAVNQLISELAQTSDPARQHAIVDQIQQYTFSQVPVVALVSAASWNEYQTNHYVGWPTAANPYANPSATWPNPEIILQHLRPAQ